MAKKQYDPTTKKWYTDKELGVLRKQLYAQLAEDGFQDIERLTPRGEVDDRYLGGRERTVSIHAMLPDDEDALPEDLDLFKFQDSPHAAKFRLAERCALDACLRREEWELCAAWAMYADGYSEREIARDLERSRGKVRRLLLDLKQTVDQRGYALALA